MSTPLVRACEPATCMVCGGAFNRRLERAKTSRFCSVKCFNLVKSTCVHCGKESTGAPNRQFCSRPCQRRHGNGPLQNRAHVQRTKARKRGTATEPINLEDIFQRDKWKCQLCKRSINQSLKHPDPLSGTIDHIVPLSKGGAHVWSNLQAAHFTCNTRKGTRTLGQFRLGFDTERRNRVA